MKRCWLIVLLFGSAVFGQTAPFASQSDLVADLSDTILDGIYLHRFCTDRFGSERSLRLQLIGSHRKREVDTTYRNGFTGLLVGTNYAITCNNYFSLFAGSTWGEIDIDEESNFDTWSALFGMTWEYTCNRTFFGLAIVGGYLSEERESFGVKEEPRGVFFTPELAYSSGCFNAHLRYAGYYVRDYNQGKVLDTLCVKDRTIQMITLRGEYARCFCFCLEPYVGLAGRFQFDGNEIEGRRMLENVRFSDGIDAAIGYGFLGFRFAREFDGFDLQAHIEGGADTDESWRISGELSLSFMF